MLCYQREVKKKPGGGNLVVRKEKIEKRNQGLEGLNEMQRIVYRPVGAGMKSNETRANIVASVSELEKTRTIRDKKNGKGFYWI